MRTWWCIRATKHIDGQGRVLGGAVLGRRKWVEEVLQPFVRNTGPAMSPFNAWVLLKGLETLPLRVEAACRSAACAWPTSWPDGRKSPGSGTRLRADHPQHVELARMAQMSGGGTLVTFEVAPTARLTAKEAAFRAMNGCALIAISNNLGDSKSMVTHPATTTHMKIGAEERARLGITDGVVRLSVGLEDVRRPDARIWRRPSMASLLRAFETRGAFGAAAAE